MILSNLLALYRSLYDKGWHYMFIEEKSGNVIRYQENTDSSFQKCINYLDDPVNIIDNIYIGNAYNAANYDLLKSLNIGLIINVTKEIQNYFPENFEYFNIEVLDSNVESLKDTFSSVLDSIEKFNKKKNADENKNILIHCYYGASRSAAIITAYLIQFKKMNFENAYELMKEKRQTVNINITFVNELKQLEDNN